MLWIDYISYLWYIANSTERGEGYFHSVVNWLHFVSLIYRKQYIHAWYCLLVCCELTTFRIFDISQTVPLKFYKNGTLLWIDYISYLWYIANSFRSFMRQWRLVVNWLHFVSLIYRKQSGILQKWNEQSCELTTFRIFDISQTVKELERQMATGCELTTFRIFDISQTVGPCRLHSVKELWIDYISYLWYIANSIAPLINTSKSVVNWLHFVSLIYRKQ